MQKCPFTDMFIEQIKANNRQVYIYKIDGEFVAECVLVLDYKDGIATIEQRNYFKKTFSQRKPAVSGDVSQG